MSSERLTFYFRASPFLLLLVYTLCVPPSAALAEDPATKRNPSVDALRLTLYSGAVVSGRFVYGDSDYAQRRPLGPGGHMGARLERPVGRHFSIGGFTEWGGTSNTDIGFFELDVHLDVGLWAKARHVLDLPAFDLELYLGVPVGPSFLLAPRGDTLGALIGLRTGALAGAQLLFRKAGLFVDLGPSFRAYSLMRKRMRAENKLQLAINLGAVLLF